MDSVYVTEVIICTMMRRGNGTEEDPIRIITQVFTKDGELIAENDPLDSKIARLSTKIPK